MSKKENQNNFEKDFTLSINKDTVKEQGAFGIKGGAFKALLSSSSDYKLTQIYWLLSGKNITTADFGNEQLTGSGTLKKDGSGTFEFEVYPDCKQEGVENLNLQFFLDAGLTKSIGSDSIDIIDTSNDPNKCSEDISDKEYAIIESRLQVKENTSLFYTIANGVPGKNLYYKLSGKNIDKDDFDLSYSGLKGEIEIGEDGEAFVPVLPKNDNRTEGDEELTFTLFEDKKNKKKLSSVTVPIIDTSTEDTYYPPKQSSTSKGKQPTWGSFTDEGSWFTLSPSRPEIQENTSTRTRIDSNATEGTKLFYRASGKGINKDDFNLNYAGQSGQVELNKNGVAFIPHLIRNDYTTEGVEHLTIELFRDKSLSDLLAITSVPLLDSSIQTDSNKPTQSPAPTNSQPIWGGGTTEGSWFTLSPSRNEYEEGESSSVRIDSDAFPGTTVYWEVSGAGVNIQDMDLQADSSGMSAVETIERNGFGEIRHTYAVDGINEGDEEITISLYRDESKSELLATTSFPLLDGAAEIETNKSSLNEGQKMKFKVFANGFPVGSDFYWDVSGINIDQDDFDTRPIEGVKTLNSTQKFQLNFETKKDLKTEGLEFYQLNVYSDPEKNTLIGQSDKINLNDTSETPISTYDLISSSSEVDEGKGFKFKIKTKQVNPGSTIYLRATGTASSEDLFNENNPSSLESAVILDINGNAIIQFRTIKDQLTEGNEIFGLQAFTDSNYLNPVSEIVNVEIMDTSTKPLSIYDISTNSSSVEEGKGFKLKIKTKQVDPGTAIYLKPTGSASDQDLINETTGQSLIDPIILDSDGNAIIQFRTIKDQLTEGMETFALQAFTDSNYINPVGEIVNVDIMDTSTKPLSTYDISTNSSSVEEGKGFKLKIKTKQVDPGTAIYLKPTGSASDQDLINETTRKSLINPIILDSDGDAIIQYRTIKDSLTEGTETFGIQAFTDSAYLNPVGDSISVDILDTSTTPLPAYDLIMSSNFVNEGKGFKVKFETNNVEPGTAIYWRSTGTASDQDLINESTGDIRGGVVFIDRKGSATLEFDTVKDRLTEGLEIFGVEAFTDPNFISQVAKITTVSINDSSRGF